MSDIIYLTDVAVITCIVDKNRTDAVLHAARDMGSGGTLVHTVQTWGVRERMGVWGVAAETEADVVVFLVSTDQKDLIFDAIYEAADMDVPGRGYMFVSEVEKAATYVPEAIRNRLDTNKK